MTTFTDRRAWGLDFGRDDRLWQQDANCNPHVAEWFWLTTGSKGTSRLSADNKAALALCDNCAVLAQCLADELANPNPWPHIAAGRLWP